MPLRRRSGLQFVEFSEFMRKPILVSLGLVALAAAATSGQRRSACDASYPDFCIPPPPPDLNCGDISVHDFTVRSPDPHGFDRDHDGIGCES